MHLIDYLNSHFPATSLWSKEVLVERFMTVFGVNAKSEGDLFLFKYDMIAANWQKDLTRECRGVIVRKDKNGWKVVSRPFDKFFNQHEGHSGIHLEADFNADCKNFEFHEKGDGTCIQLWYDTHKHLWRVSTLGTITTGQVGDIPGLTFDTLFWKVWEDDLDGEESDFANFFMTEESKRTTFIFELCAAENRVLTKYNQNTIFLLAARDTQSGDYKHESFLREVAKKNKFRLPLRYSFKELGINNLEDAREWVETESEKKDVYGEYPEGFVIYKDGVPVAKMKNKDYVDKHHAIGAGDILHTRNVVIERFFSGTLDDIMDVLVDSMKEYSERLRNWWIENVREQDKVASEMRKHDFDNQKEFALYVQKHVNGAFVSFYFSNKNDILSGYAITPLLNDWIKHNWKKFEKEIKAL